MEALKEETLLIRGLSSLDSDTVARVDAMWRDTCDRILESVVASERLVDSVRTLASFREDLETQASRTVVNKARQNLRDGLEAAYLIAIGTRKGDAVLWRSSIMDKIAQRKKYTSESLASQALTGARLRYNARHAGRLAAEQHGDGTENGASQTSASSLHDSSALAGSKRGRASGDDLADDDAEAAVGSQCGTWKSKPLLL